MRNIMAFTALTLAIGVAAPALASEIPACGSAPRDQWMSEEAIKAKATELGYQVRKVKVEDNCYEVYGIDQKGTKTEIYFNPVTGVVAQTKSND
jgi:hypothetical protein